MTQEAILISGTANPGLAASIAKHLGVTLGAATTERFPDGETHVRLLQPVRGRHVFLIQPTSPPVNDHLIELLCLADACRRASAERVTALVPYFGYARSDKRHAGREPIAASMVAELLQTVGINHVVTLDLHAAQIEGFFHIPVDSLTALPVLCQAIAADAPPGLAVVSPDAGRVKQATEYARRLRAPVVVLHKRRESGTETQVTHVVGDVRGRPCLIIDDMISTGGTIARAIEALLEAGAQPNLIVASTHALWIGGARQKLAHAAVKRIFTTDSIAQPSDSWPELRVVSIAALLASAIQRIISDGSISELY